MEYRRQGWSEGDAMCSSGDRCGVREGLCGVNEASRVKERLCKVQEAGTELRRGYVE
jgi:hypothetical protein